MSKSAGVDYCVVHHGLRNEDEQACDNARDDDLDCELRPLHYEVAPARSYGITYHSRPWTLNAERSGSRWDHRKWTSEWREAFGWLARQKPLPKFERCRIDVHVTANLPPLADTAACVGAAKAAIDGIVDAGRLRTDTGDVVLSITFHPPARTGSDSLTITVTEVTE